MNNQNLSECEEILGLQGKDKITGFEGIITGYCQYLTGCAQLCISPKAEQNNFKDSHWFDINRVEATGPGIDKLELSGTDPGGPECDAPLK